jgi:hypothetical protein
MADRDARFQVGDVGQGAVVLQGEDLTYLQVALQQPNPAAVEALVRQGLDAAARAGAQRHLGTLPLGAVPEPAGYLPPGSHLPLRPNPLFVGRDAELRALAAALKGGQAVAITGLGGWARRSWRPSSPTATGATSPAASSGSPAPTRRPWPTKSSNPQWKALGECGPSICQPLQIENGPTRCG